MGEHLQKILEEIREERDYQDTRHGTDFDDKNDLDNWIRYIITYCGRSSQGPPLQQRWDMLKVAAIAVAACEAFDRNGSFPPRHYEDLQQQGYSSAPIKVVPQVVARPMDPVAKD